jgi:hypothetical protein
VIAAFFSIGGCKIRFGGGGRIGNLNLNIPYFNQPTFLLCGPTSVLMWRRYDTLPYMNPQALGTQMGCRWWASGCSMEEIVGGARGFTYTGVDAYLDDWGGVVGDPDLLAAEFMARQITSLKNGIPVIAIIEGGLHAVVAKGGHYTTAANGLRQWEWVIYHDPFGSTPGTQVSAARWLETNIHQVISQSATTGWQTYYDNHAATARVRGTVRWPRNPQP